MNAAPNVAPSVVELLERAAEQRTRLVMLLKVEPKFAPLRGEPRFRALLEELGLGTREEAS